MNDPIYFLNQGMTPADALAAYTAQAPTYRRVPIDEVNFFLIDRFLNGRLRLARDNTAMPVQVRAFLGDFLMGIQIAKSFDGTSETIRNAAAAALGVLVQAGVMTADESAAFQAMMVEPIPAITLAEVERIDRQRQADDAIAPHVASINEFRGALATWVQDGGEMPAWAN